MTRDETQQYVRHQLRIAGQVPEAIITQDALQAVFSASQGIPRLVNQLMDHAMVLVAQHATDSITQDVIHDSWGKLQQMPTLWSTSSSASHASSAMNPIEFGSLEEDGPAFTSPVTQHLEEPFIDDEQCLDPLKAIDAVEAFEASADYGQNFFAAFSLQDSPVAQAQPSADPFEILPAQASQYTGFDASLRDEDTMDVWENDPPLRTAVTASKGLEAASYWDLDTEEKTEELFGSDFDLELSVPHHASLTKPNFGSDEQPSIETSSLSACDAPPEDYLARMQDTAENLVQASQFSDTELIQIDGLLASQGWCNQSIDLPHWSIQIAADTGGNAVEESIEDIVSQLNFSAFMVEPFSVEQIPLRADSASNAFGSLHDHSHDLPEGIRVNDQQQVLMLHRPVEDTPFSSVHDAYDDDRDLLIVEEQVPLSSQLLSQNLPSEPAQRPAPYNQLFSRLRR